jgi:hypothetical protein
MDRSLLEWVVIAEENAEDGIQKKEDDCFARST